MVTLVADADTDETETDETDTDDDAVLAAPAPLLLVPEYAAVVLVCEIDQAV
jgi:hypothetical protein